MRNCGQENVLLRTGEPVVSTDKKRRVRERLKEAEKRLQKNQPVALRWREAGKALMVILEDLTVLQYKFTDARGPPDVQSIKIDHSVADQSQERLLSADIGVTCQLMVASTRNGRLLLFDARKHERGAAGDHLGASGTRLLEALTASSVALPGPASRVRINCSSDLVLAQCGSHVVIIHVTSGPQGRKSGPAVRQMFLSPEEADKARAPTVTDDVISCRFSRHLPNRVLVVQRARAQGTSLEFLARAFEYREAERQLDLVTSSTVVGLESNVTAVAWSPREDQVVLGTRDGGIFLHDLGRGTLRTVPGCGRGEVDLLTWHPDGALIAAAFGNGEVLFLDGALQRTELESDLKPALESLHLSKVHGFKCHVALFEWAVQPAKPAPDSAEGSCLHAALVMERGPVDVLRFPVRSSGGRLRARDVVKHYIEDGTPEKALEVAAALPDALERYHCLLQILPALLRQTLKPRAADALLDRAAQMIASPTWDDVSPQQREALRALARRYGQRLIRAGCAERAFRLGRKLEDDALLSDVLVWAVRNDEAPLADAVKRLIVQPALGNRDAGGGPLSAAASLPTPSEFRALSALAVW
ncbi:hypothetical protein KFL_004070060 [Klebsormidium nitens]|uniref:Uncharacterized protein n=1 Tax=Klebsormidium nitens TaxID=105231 RepID=A0A1Y1IB40_KLENI|nr:hypothetical protein KFL_004070060 [Klebsormidium nitens]|eukprot:GAQ88184.1 hypothetical protein KFL_004070060 [Klebsormidium nitens]